MSACVQPEMNPPLLNHFAELLEQALVPAAQSGDAIAFVELVRRHANKVRSRIYQIMKNREDVEDVFQETLIRAFINIRRFECRSSFSTWLTRIAINSALMRLRRRRWTEIPLQNVSADFEKSSFWEPSDDRDTPEEGLVRREKEEWVNKAILDLPPTLRIVVQMRQTQGCSIKDIAIHLGISLPAVKSRLTRARQRLRISLAAFQGVANLSSDTLGH